MHWKKTEVIKIFREASKAFQEINNRKKDSGLGIRAEFARPRQQSIAPFVPEPLAQPRIHPSKDSICSSEKIDDIVIQLPICLDLAQPHDGLTEKVTQFERQKVQLHAKSIAMLELCDKQSKKSCGNFDHSEVRQIHLRNSNPNLDIFLFQGHFIYNEKLAKMFEDRCINCGSSAILRSLKTDESFCSINCSLKKQEVVKVLGKNEIHRVDKLEVRDKVQIVSVISEKIVFVRQMSDSDIPTVTKIFKLSRKSNKLEMFPEVGDLALAEIDSEICRVLVLRVPEIESEEILVQLIDYGNTALVMFEDLLEMNLQVQAIPCTAMKVNLLDVNNPIINFDIINYLIDLRNLKVELTVSQVSADGVQLKNGVAAATSVNQTIVNLAEISETPDDIEIDYNVSSIFQHNLNKNLFKPKF